MVASEIAVVKATVVRDGGILKSYNIGSSAYDVIYDLLPDDVVTLTTELKNKEDASFYGFNCWIDGSNVVLKSDEGCQYGFDGAPIKNSARLKNKNDDETVSEWIRNHASELDDAWEKINRGENPGIID